MKPVMAEVRVMSFDRPVATVSFPHLTSRNVVLGDSTVGLIELQPGWRWSTDVRPEVGGEWCQARHVGVVLSGRFGVHMSDGTTFEFGPNDVFEIPPGHDGWTIGDEPCVQIEWQGLRAFTGYRLMGGEQRSLVTLLFTDIVGSTSKAASVGDVAWRELLSSHYEAARGAVERYGGTEVNTTGDGFLATFDGPAVALHCASEIRRKGRRDGISIRASVHVGEVEHVGRDVRGIAVHEAARIMGEAAPDEILVSATTRALARGAQLEFAEAGARELKGLDGKWELFSFRERDEAGS
jgi:class 3 adenylate cyclase